VNDKDPDRDNQILNQKKKTHKQKIENSTKKVNLEKPDEK
jgi:hypothetical protein